MANQMSMADLQLVDDDAPNSQTVAVLDQPRKVRIARAAIPEPDVGEIRVRVRFVGICGSDLEAYRGVRSPEFLSTPARLGHEVSGVIDAVGPGVRTLRVGMRVTCRYVWGAFAEYIVCRPFNVHVVPDTLEDEDISPLEVLPGVLHAAELARITPNTDVLIMGQGVSGLVMTQVAALFSPRTLAVTDLKDRNLELSRRYGATHTYRVGDEQASNSDVIAADHPHGFEVVIPCLLEGDGMTDAVNCAALGGRIIMYGCIGPTTRPFDWFKVHRRRLSILSTEPRRDIDMRRFWDEGVALVEQGLVNVAEMITHRYALTEIQAAFDVRNEIKGDAIHVIIDCSR